MTMQVSVTRGFESHLKRAWGLAGIAQSLEVSIPFLRKEIRNGNLKAIRLGRRVLVSNEELERYLAEGSRRVPGRPNE